MIRLNLTATPEWLDLAPGLRLLVGPLTTALMVSTVYVSGVFGGLCGSTGGLRAPRR